MKTTAAKKTAKKIAAALAAAEAADSAYARATVVWAKAWAAAVKDLTPASLEALRVAEEARDNARVRECLARAAATLAILAEAA